MPGKDLVTESCVRKLAPGSVLRLTSERIATPAALDLAFQRGIRVVHADEPESSQAPPRGSDLWQKMRADDGTYVVVVRNGRATVTRLEDGGPRPFGEE